MDKALSPQQRWAAKQKRRGRCTRCGSKREHYTSLCDSCQDLRSQYMRKYRAAIKQAQLAKTKALKGVTL